MLSGFDLSKFGKNACILSRMQETAEKRYATFADCRLTLTHSYWKLTILKWVHRLKYCFHCYLKWVPRLRYFRLWSTSIKIWTHRSKANWPIIYIRHLGESGDPLNNSQFSLEQPFIPLIYILYLQNCTARYESGGYRGPVHGSQENTEHFCTSSVAKKHVVAQCFVILTIERKSLQGMNWLNKVVTVHDVILTKCPTAGFRFTGGVESCPHLCPLTTSILGFLLP